MILAEGISKSYGSLQILNNVSLKVESGEIVSIIGPSGAGKTTLLQILGTLDVMDNPKGKLTIGGTLISELSGKALSKFRNEKIGFVFQFHNLLPEFTAIENVCIPAFIRKTKTDIAEKRAGELLRFLNLSHRKDHKPNALSGGEQQRVAIARALMNSPLVVFADEPTGNLDSKSADSIHELFIKLREELGQTFVIVTHNKTLSEMTDRKIEMKDGKLI